MTNITLVDVIPNSAAEKASLVRAASPWLEQAQAGASPETLRLWQALEEVEDPEYPISVVDMGLICSLALENETAKVELTFTSMGCPCMEYIIEDIRTRLLQESSVKQVQMEIVWDPPWTRNRLTPKAIEQLKTWGISA